MAPKAKPNKKDKEREEQARLEKEKEDAERAEQERLQREKEEREAAEAAQLEYDLMMKLPNRFQVCRLDVNDTRPQRRFGSCTCTLRTYEP